MKFQSIRIEGGILSPDIFDKIETELKGQNPEAFGLPKNEKVKDEIARTWADALAYWGIFQRRLEQVKEGATGTTETRQQWIIPLLGLLNYDIIYQKAGIERNEKKFLISHLATNRADMPVHITDYLNEAGLDKRTGQGATKMSAHAMLQEYINLGEELYGIVTNGRILRILRNSSRLVKLSYLEFDLERMFNENLFSDFAILFRLIHATRFSATTEESADCYFEQYHQESLDAGARIREGLSEAVEKAILTFGNGLLNHPDNVELRTAIDNATLKPRDYYQILLRLIYRILFLMVIEERDLVYPKGTSEKMRRIYNQYYSVQRLRKLSENRWLGNKRHHDLWIALMNTFNLFETDGSGKKLGLYPLGGELFSSTAIDPISRCTLDNATLLNCMRHLNQYQNKDTGQMTRVNYAALNVEEFGSVYEGLLEYEAQINKDDSKYKWALVQGSERAQTGSHYTADSLVQPLIKHSLEPLIEKALKSEAPERALLALRVADITSGTGHTLLAASRRIATTLASVRTGEDQPSPRAYRKALKEVIHTCIYGVDINPLAVELCKVALWLESHNPGQPLNFLDHHIKCGNAIVGYVKEEDIDGIPNEAFKAVEKDDKEVVRDLKKLNTKERNANQNQTHMHFDSYEKEDAVEQFRKEWHRIAIMPETTIEEIQAKKAAYIDFSTGETYQQYKLIASIPIAQFFAEKTEATKDKLITTREFGGYWDGLDKLSEEKAAYVKQIIDEQKIFHWFLEFPEVMQNGGFDCILGNPPYLGGQALSGTFGKYFCNYVKWMFAPTGLSELAVYFLRRIHTIIREGGFSGVITTNSIADGDIGRDGLNQILSQNGSIVMAVRAIKWPGKANLYVSLLSVHKGKWHSFRMLDNQKVNYISALFEEFEDLGDPKVLPNNLYNVFQGSILLGKGFILTHEEANDLIEEDKENEEVIYKLLNGKEINSIPDQKPLRSVINFHNWSLEEVKKYRHPYEIVSELVKSEREGKKGDVSNWWLYLRPRSGLYNILSSLERCFITTAHTKYLNFSSISTNYVFTHALQIFTTDRWDLYSVVQSSIHEQWARKYSGALATILRYSPTNCFATFPFPGNIWEEQNSELEQIGEAYHTQRKALMLKLWLGLTEIYNLFHDPDLNEEKIAKKCKNPEDAPEGYRGIQKLRDLHTELDNKILKAYGWQDITLNHNFREIDTLPETDRIRYAMTKEARKELLQRLLQLNLDRTS